MPELFDVVDEDDKPTGKLVTKQQAHADGTLHRLVAVYVFDSDGKLFVQDHKASGLWDHSVGGHVSADEDYQTAALREAREELGLFDQVLVEVFSGLHSDELFDPDVQNDFQMHYFSIYECRPDANWKFTPNDEVGRIFPVELEIVVKQMRETPGKFTPGLINTMAKYLEVRGLPYPYDLAQVQAAWGSSYKSLPK